MNVVVRTVDFRRVVSFFIDEILVSILLDDSSSDSMQRDAEGVDGVRRHARDQLDVLSRSQQNSRRSLSHSMRLTVVSTSAPPPASTDRKSASESSK